MYEPSQRDGLLALGLGAIASARHFYRKKQLRPFQASVIVAWPAIGVAIMQTVINWSTPHTLEVLRASDGDAEAAKAREASSVLRERLRHLAAQQGQQDDQLGEGQGSSSSSRV
mmetsp:Transcript_7485/g.18548  ORF Transcript_7485/g.18548 Transcript_7485/m.18548 type:complete len:114 (-) Transcript_7485:296-637(-)|eukprot:CAMPEP_0202859076 /NCGR_PEP_ID=MMETSP1391-20130828/1353_1 /ASSEMBLY_ACC=CAM_ASM_000867 /TAXON_ID=1034604 /ORGANISM="Chlamydomonas leiostraca, Strain SAG 11-49" /LENGTH=113 /DNA_ID=CAMNT_0049538081 /DNA_START=75 /DNA_END=416 /DNA_ORIENTATION=-